jgi:AcrR family transcriptional regulator
MPKAFSEQEKQTIEQRLRKTAAERFAAQGLQKTSVEELAQAAGISKGAFYGFFESKEALFMAVAEEAEAQFRARVLAAVEGPGRSPRARLVAVLTEAYSSWRQIPVLQFFAHSEYERLLHRVPREIFDEHVEADEVFMRQLITRCREQGIPIQIAPKELRALTYALFFTSFHEEDPLPLVVPGTLALLIELVAAYCLGEVELSSHLKDNNDDDRD